MSFRSTAVCSPPRVFGVRTGALGLLAIALLLAPGCSAKGPKTVVVKGKVTYQGKAVPRGMITFQPAELSQTAGSHPASGEIQPDGRFKMSTFKQGDGVLPGKYQVTIRALESEPQAEDLRAKPVWLIPPKYGDVSRTPLTVNVPADAKGAIEQSFELTP